MLVHRLLPYFPADLGVKRYHEPFAGAASLFFSLKPKSAQLSDLNEHLIECYKQVRDNYVAVASYLREHKRLDSVDHYYRVRDLYNRSSFGAPQAARFVYLNQTCFNGVFRVNKSGQFNVPYGDKPEPIVPTTAELALVSESLKHATLTVSHYENAFAKVKNGDFVYLDPPYPPLNGTSFFTHYTRDRFSAEDQEQLASAVRVLHKRGALFLMTNADLPAIRKLYRGFYLSELSVTRYVSCKGTRYKIGELVITNYKPVTEQQRQRV